RRRRRRRDGRPEALPRHPRDPRRRAVGAVQGHEAEGVRLRRVHRGVDQGDRVGQPGKLRFLLSLLRDHGAAVEADLQRFYGIDDRDRWRPDEHGRPRLTLRRLWVLISHLPPESTLAHIERAGHPEWTLEAHLLDTIRM